MAGTDRSKTTRLGGPAVVLVDPQLGENIGMVARAMLNCGLSELRLVRPRDGWPNEAAVSAAAGADTVLEHARLYDTTAAAVADLARVYAATARPRGMVKPVVTPRRAAAELRAALAEGLRAGLLFGPERSGLVNDDLALADTLLAVPLNPAFASLNLAMAVLLVGYEWFQVADATPPRRLEAGGQPPAGKAELVNFFQRLEAALDETGFLHPPEKRPGMVRNLRNMIQRLEPTDQDLRTLHGIISALRSGRRGD
ncbi:MAG: RNA methyltransferase [Rhodospirillales bacterium]|nr:RNA methyltransferase [Rhodospirillales bacterium]MDH3909732.1 RNA methyltransferase [Rhodospirillales bacterium]MDH3919675.1 RNA methyltransferase [Rhodospirillales bacterium]MDH3965542.1 RNA methyltransferase [Rhodospirillales bacterium]